MESQLQMLTQQRMTVYNRLTQVENKASSIPNTDNNNKQKSKHLLNNMTRLQNTMTYNRNEISQRRVLIGDLQAKYKLLSNELDKLKTQRNQILREKSITTQRRLQEEQTLKEQLDLIDQERERRKRDAEHLATLGDAKAQQELVEIAIEVSDYSYDYGWL